MVDPSDPTRIWAGGPSGLRLLNADGWTRWWNPTEFPSNGTVFSYRDGVYGTPAAAGPFNATLCGYKVFAAALEKGDPITKLLSLPLGHPNGRSTFHTSGIETRRYKLVFPGDGSGGPDLIFNYAVDACHGFPDGYKPGDYIDVPDGFPPDANQIEPFILDTNITGNTLYLLPQGCMGGSLEFNIRVSDWQALLADTPVSGQIESIKITSPTLFVGMRTPELVSDSTPPYPWATYRVRLEGLTPDSPLDQQILVTVVSSEGDYQPKVSSYNGSSPLASYFVMRVPISQTGPIGGGGFKLNPFSPWPKTGADSHNTECSIAKGPDEPSPAWEVVGLSYSTKPVVDAEGRVFVSRRLANGGVTLMALDSSGLPSAQIDLPDFEPGGDPLVVGCSIVWSSGNGRVIRIYPDGTYEELFDAPSGGPSVYGMLNIDDEGRAFVHGASGIHAFDEDGNSMWSILNGDGALSMFIGPSSITGLGVIVLGQVKIQDSSDYAFRFMGINPSTGGILWKYEPSIQHTLAYGSSADPGIGQLYFSLANHLQALTNDGAERWSFEAAETLSSNIAIAKNGTVYAAEVGSGSSGEEDKYKLYALDKYGNLLWPFTCSSPILGGPIIDANGYIYIATRDAEVFSLGPDGSQRWKVDLAGRTAYLTFGPTGSLLLGLNQPQYTTSMVCLRDSN
jgi:outer membrane protein assembly factor BamB